eukprot:PhF_6_TR32135/c0_g2_i5/m.47587
MVLLQRKKLASVIMNLPNPDQIKTFLTSTLPTLQLLLRNILSLPAEDKYRCLKTSSNVKLRDVVVNTPGVEAFVGEIGFIKDVAGNYVLPLMASLKVIQDALSELTHVEMDVAIHLTTRRHATGSSKRGIHSGSEGESTDGRSGKIGTVR